VDLEMVHLEQQILVVAAVETKTAVLQEQVDPEL
jgi:hypothetical protein